MSKKPQAGEWWEHNTTANRYFIVGVKRNGDVLIEHRHGDYENGGQDWYDWHHEPDCTGWDWKPETFPQYWSTPSTYYAYLLRIDAKRCCLVDKKGNQLTDQPWYDKTDRAGRTQLTKEEALERLDKPEPVESSDDWVTQDRVPAREKIDKGWWTKPGESPKSDKNNWWTVHKISSGYGKKHGHVSRGVTINLFCRRKDLPPLESPDDWVEITHTHPDHIPRVGIDWFTTWDDNPVDSSRWVKQESYHTKKTVAVFLKESQGRHKCRRKDLPPITPPKPAMRTVTLYKWIVWDEEGEESERWQSDTPESWCNYYKTGESKTVEVPVDVRPD